MGTQPQDSHCTSVLTHETTIYNLVGHFNTAILTQDTGFFRGWGGAWDTEYGHFFMTWYANALLLHGQHLCQLANSIFHTSRPQCCSLGYHNLHPASPLDMKSSSKVPAGFAASTASVADTPICDLETNAESFSDMKSSNTIAAEFVASTQGSPDGVVPEMARGSATGDTEAASVADTSTSKNRTDPACTDATLPQTAELVQPSLENRHSSCNSFRPSKLQSVQPITDGNVNVYNQSSARQQKAPLAGQLTDEEARPAAANSGKQNDIGVGRQADPQQEVHGQANSQRQVPAEHLATESQLSNGIASTPDHR